MPSPTPAPHPGSDYYVNVVTHTIQQQSNPLLGRALLAAGFIGPYDYATAKGVAAGITHEQTNAPVGSTLPLGGKAQANPLAGVAAIGDFFNRLTQANTWLRVGEVAAGLMLLYIGLKATTSGTAVGSAASSAAKPVKAVASATPVGRTVRAERTASRIVRAKKETVAVQRATARKQANSYAIRSAGRTVARRAQGK